MFERRTTKPSTRLKRSIAVLGLAFGLGDGAHAQAPRSQPAGELIAALSAARLCGCDGQPGLETRLRPVGALGEAAWRIARGDSPDAAAKAAGYRATRLFVARMSGYRTPAAVAQAMAGKHCKALSDPNLTDLGIHRRDDSYWMVLAAPFAPPPQSAGAVVAARVLALTNEARSRARKCGTRLFEATAPVTPNPLLDRAAAVHAREMAQHSHFEHQGRDGSGPAERVARTGYRWRSVGENIASGQTTPEEVVHAWLASPTHCANLMNPGFMEMGVAFGVNMNSESGIYWAQKFARPR